MRACLIGIVLSFAAAWPAAAQPPDADTRQTLVEDAQADKATADTRQTLVESAQADKATKLKSYQQTGLERLMGRAEDILYFGTVKWHPFFQSAALGGGLPLGVGYMAHVSSYNTLDMRGSYSIYGYRRIEAEFLAPRLFKRRGTLSVIGGWRDASQVNFYGTGMDTTPADQAQYGFKQGRGAALLTVRPTQRYLTVAGGFEVTRWSPEDATGTAPPVESIYTPTTLPGLGATVTYLHTQATVGFDMRQAAGYARRGGFYGVTAHDYHDRDDRFSYRELDYDAIQHIPILRESWVLSLHGRAETTISRDNQDVPYFLLPHLGGGSTLRGFESWRFRDRNKLLLQAEWRIMVNRFMDTAVFYDAGKVGAHKDDIDFNGLKSDYGFGARFHTPFMTVLRVEVARSNETTRLVVSTSPVF